MRRSNSQIIYFKHRFGFTLLVASITFFYIIFFESNLREIFLASPWLFFWTWSVSLLSVPLITGLSWGDSLKFFAYSFPLFFLIGLIALTIPTHLVARFASILAIIWIIALAYLIKRNPKVFDLKVSINPYMFIESIAILGLSFLCSYPMLFSFKLIDTLVASLSSYANYLLLTLIFYVAFSIITITLRLIRKIR